MKKRTGFIHNIDFDELRLCAKLGGFFGLSLFPPGLLLWLLAWVPPSPAGAASLNAMSLVWLQRAITVFLIAGWSAAATSLARQAADFILKSSPLLPRYFVNLFAGASAGLLVANCLYEFFSLGLPMEALISRGLFFLTGLCFCSYLSTGLLFMNSMPHIAGKYRSLWIFGVGMLSGVATPLVIFSALQFTR